MGGAVSTSVSGGSGKLRRPAAGEDRRAIMAARAALAAADVRLAARDQELRDLATILSHDLRAPLRRLQLFAEMARERGGGADTELAGYLSHIHAGAERMERLLGDLVTYARLETSPDRICPIDLGVLVREVVEDAQARLDEAGGRIVVGELPVIDGDANLMRQLLGNLVDNAIEFRRLDVPLEIAISARSRSAPPGVPETDMTVADNGIGFDNQNAERIFDVFERLDGDGVHDGTGIGLAICRKVAQLHGGSIAADGELGRGSTFTLRLPVARSQELLT